MGARTRAHTTTVYCVAAATKNKPNIRENMQHERAAQSTSANECSTEACMCHVSMGRGQQVSQHVGVGLNRGGGARSLACRGLRCDKARTEVVPQHRRRGPARVSGADIVDASLALGGVGACLLLGSSSQLARACRLVRTC